MLKDNRSPFREAAGALGVFTALRIVEFLTLVGVAASILRADFVDRGITTASTWFLPLVGAAGFYIGFGYIFVSGIVFFLAWRRFGKRSVVLLVANVVPLAVMGLGVLLLLYEDRIPAYFLWALGSGVVVNALASTIARRYYSVQVR